MNMPSLAIIRSAAARLAFGLAAVLALCAAPAPGAAASAPQIQIPSLAPAADLVPITARFELFRQGADQVLAVLWIEPAKGWHTYAHVNGQAGAPLVAQVSLGPGKPEPRLVYPRGKAEPDVFEPDKSVYVHDAPAPVVAVLPPGLSGPLSLAGTVRAVLCSDVNCRMETVQAKLDTPALDPAKLPRAEDQPWYAAYLADSTAGSDEPAGLAAAKPAVQAQPPQPGPAANYAAIKPRFAEGAMEVADFGKAVIFALLAGLILNVMPCVLPVASLKFSGILAASAEDPRRRFKDLRVYNIFFALGILTYFLILSVVLGLAGMAWGQLFQSTGFILAMAVVVFALSLSLFGLYNLPVIDLKRAPKAAGHVNTRLTAYATGILATLLATPCSGPFLGGVLAWTMIQPVWVISTVFVCIGVGMSGPYLFFALRPDLIRFFPKPGHWLEYLEKGVGFVLLATSLYLLSVLPAKYVFPSLFTLLAIAVAAWMWGQWTSLADRPARRRTVRTAAALLVAVAAYFAFAEGPPAEAPWEDFSAARFAELHGRENILVDFTADWCPNCKLLEKTALTDQNRAKWKKNYNLRYLRADLTSENPEAMALLKALNSQAIPTAALFAKGPGANSPLVLRDLFTASRLSDALAATLKK